MKRQLICVPLAFALSCVSFPDFSLFRVRSLPLVSKGYQPIDPIPIATDESMSRADLLRSLPNESIRLAIAQIGRDRRISYAPVTFTTKGEQYLVVLDYIKYNTRAVDASVFSHSARRSGASQAETGIKIGGEPCAQSRSATEDTSAPNAGANPRVDAQAENAASYSIPVYRGVGLRMIASITSTEDGVAISSFYDLGIAANQKRLSGNLAIQTLGITGESVSPLIPMPSEVSPASIQNSIQALATIKSKLYDAKTDVTPQILAVEDYIGTEDSLACIVAHLHRKK